MAEPAFFSFLPDDVTLHIFLNLHDDPRHWARLSCVCTRFSSLINNLCCKLKCSQTIPSVVSDLLSGDPATAPPGGWPSLLKLSVCCPGLLHAGVLLNTSHNASSSHMDIDDPCNDNFHLSKRRKISRSARLSSHLASAIWNLSREQGSKLLSRQFRDDCLYICDWPGCLHSEEKRKYMLFRGIFKDFKRSRVYRTVNDGTRRRSGLSCAFCECKETWDLHSAFCLRRFFGFHNDGEPVVRAYVCDNGHVSGAWTDLPLYT